MLYNWSLSWSLSDCPEHITLRVYGVWRRLIIYPSIHIYVLHLTMYIFNVKFHQNRLMKYSGLYDTFTLYSYEKLLFYFNHFHNMYTIFFLHIIIIFSYININFRVIISNLFLDNLLKR